MRFELDGLNFVVMLDLFFLKYYKVDYVNMLCNVNSIVLVNIQIFISLSIVGSGGILLISSGGNVLNICIENMLKNQFWELLEKNIKDFLCEMDKILLEGFSEIVVE